MQDHVKPYSYTIAGRGPGYASESEFITQYDIRRFIKRYMKTILVATLLGSILAAVYVFNAVPLFTARTQIIIDPSLPQAMQQSRQDGIFSIDNAQVESQLEVLRSEKIAMAVIKRLKLEDQPEFIGGGGSWLSLPFQLFQSAPADTAFSRFLKERATLGRFQSGLNVRRVGMSYAIEILFSARSPELAAKIANATADAYIGEQISARAQSARLGGLWLEERINQLRSQMNNAALKAQEFRAKRDYRIAGARGGAEENRAADNNRVADNATAARDSAEKRKNTMEELDSTAQTYRRIYESYLMAYTESVQKQSYSGTNARVITEATPPLGKSHPRTKLILAFGAFMGGLVGLGIAFFRNSIDRCVLGPRQIREEVGVECLASIPLLADPVSMSASARARAMLRKGAMGDAFKSVVNKPSTTSSKAFWAAISFARRALGSNKAAGDEQRDTVLDAVITMPYSGFSHGIKTLKTAIALAGRTRQIRCIAVTSALPGEGKTSICANLATLFAVSGLRTLLVDGDLRNASLTRALAPTAEYGLIDAIMGNAKLAQCVVPANESSLDLLPAFGSAQTPYPDDILGSERAQALLRDLQTTYDIVLIELPPLAASLDGLAIGSLLDSTVLVAEYGKTPLLVLSEALHLLRNAQAEVLGVALNKVDTSTVHYGDVAASYIEYASRRPTALTRV
jgi:polysaccharide biosynthesis transport protein